MSSSPVCKLSDVLFYINEKKYINGFILKIIILEQWRVLWIHIKNNYIRSNKNKTDTCKSCKSFKCICCIDKKFGKKSPWATVDKWIYERYDVK